MSWSIQITNKTRELKKIILIKKILMNFMIDSYEIWDKIFRWTHMFFALSIPLLISAQEISLQSSQGTGPIGIGLSIIVAGMLKLKDHITYGKIRDHAKEQSIKYGNLYDSIERELLKPDLNRQSDMDFFYWITREFNSIELADPEITISDKKKFTNLCKIKNIPIMEDFYKLEQLLGESNNNSNCQTEQDTKEQEVKEQEVKEQEVKEQKVKEQEVKEQKVKEQDITKQVELNNKDIKIDIYNRYQSFGDINRVNFQNDVKNMNVKSDMKWALERLNNVD